MNRPQALFTYDGLPILSGGGHRIRVRDHKTVWTVISDFLSVYTTCSQPEDVHLVLYEGHQVAREFISRALAQASQKYGTPKRGSRN
jgi:hypothetical protein